MATSHNNKAPASLNDVHYGSRKAATAHDTAPGLVRLSVDDRDRQTVSDELMSANGFGRALAATLIMVAAAQHHRPVERAVVMAAARSAVRSAGDRHRDR